MTVQRSSSWAIDYHILMIQRWAAWGGEGRKEPLVKLAFNFVKVFTSVAAAPLLCCTLPLRKIAPQLTRLSPFGSKSNDQLCLAASDLFIWSLLATFVRSNCSYPKRSHLTPPLRTELIELLMDASEGHGMMVDSISAVSAYLPNPSFSPFSRGL